VSPRWGKLRVVDGDDLVDPADEGGHLHVDARHVAPAAAEAPRHQPRQLVEPVVLAHQWPSAVTLSNIHTLHLKKFFFNFSTPNIVRDVYIAKSIFHHSFQFSLLHFFHSAYLIFLSFLPTRGVRL
jgi:hypothetical protein